MEGQRERPATWLANKHTPVSEPKEEDTMSQLMPVGLSLSDLFHRVLAGNKGTAGAQSAIDLSDWADLLLKIKDGSIIVPTKLNELNQDQVLVHHLEAKAALDLGIPLGSFKIDGSTSVFVQDYAKYREIAYGQTTVLIGVAIRYSVVFRVLNASIQLQSLPTIAAAAQLGFIDSGAVFDVRGMSSRNISKAIPIVPSLNVEAYAAYSDALRTIKDLMWEADTVIDPVPIVISR